MKRMLINATQAEERRLAIVDGQKLLDYEIEIEGREQRKGNIYKAVVTRVEPSLEACFVDYGEDRHGFLPFKEISRSYFAQGVPVSQARINDVIREGQELLVQVEKEERGNKGAALTTFVSLAGRYVVLMPNNPRGGGVSRRIEGDDRAELKEAMDQLEYPNGMSIIARTAGIGRSAPELQWDLNYLLKLWNAIDGAAKGGKGAFLIYQESSLVIRAIRDYFNHDIGDILIDTDDIYEQAQQFMAHVMPEHATRVKRYRDDSPLFSRFQIEHQIESAYAREVKLPSGGVIVIDHTEALVSIDVNSARAIKGGDIEETATRTNLEAADEVARQMRLRDLGGLIVIDFIDMEESKNRREVESRLRDALRQDRARVQFGTISKFGLMEMSRQRLRPALSEGASVPCPRCGGHGHIRDTESSALQILRIIQEESLKDGTAAVHVQVPVEVASFLLNEKRTEIAKIELKQRLAVIMVPNKTLETPNYRLERLKHDDPRLDNLQASYHMAQDYDAETTVTRRTHERANKQEPVIKGVLPDAPAPIVEPKPEPVKTAPAAKVPPAAPAPAPVAAETGFVGWLKSLFGMPPAPVAAPAAAAAPARKEERREGRAEVRADGRGEGRGDGRRGGRGGRDGERQGARRGEGRGRDGEQRRERAVAEGQDATSRGAEGGRRDQEPRRDGEQRRGERQRGERQERGEGRTGEDQRDNREGRGGERPGQRERRDGDVRMPVDGQPAGLQAGAEMESGEQRPPRGERGDRGEGRRERGERGEGRGRRERGERRDERGPRQPVQGEGAEVAALAGAATSVGVVADMGDQQAPIADAVLESHTHQDASRTGPEGEERRDRRSRDRYGRDRRERGERQPREDAAELAVGQSSEGAVPSEADAPARTRYPTGFVTEEAESAEAAMPVQQATFAEASVPAEAPAAAPAAGQPEARPAPAAQAPVRAALAKVQPFELPVAALAQVAEGSGLQWVNSDAAKIAAAQAAMAAEPKPIRVPRERPPVIVVDEGPLVLVETRRDLRELRLPFEQTALPLQ
jgi:ribonuclease E